MVKTGPSWVRPSCWTIHTTGSGDLDAMQSVYISPLRWMPGSAQEQQQSGVKRCFQPIPLKTCPQERHRADF